MPSKKINIPSLWKKFTQSQLIIPITALVVLVIFNLIRDPSFFSIVIKKNNLGNTVLAGNLISILNGASELVILAIGMTFVTSATRGQDISVGASAAIAGSVFVKILRANTITVPVILLALVCACLVAIVFCLFNGLLISKFNTFSSYAPLTGSMTQVYSGPRTTADVGTIEYYFTTPFVWDGVSNIVLSSFVNHPAGVSHSS